jgi:Pyruvate/2-oxoacid:ferredoxin oxidoreductase gamma subunit
LERAIFLSGLGGQGVQLAAKMLALAAMRSGYQVMMFGTYGGEMRGGDTDATVVIGHDRLVTPPVVDHGWAAITMHPRSWPLLVKKIGPGGVALINSTVFEQPAIFEGAIVQLPATSMAAEAGVPQAGSLIALGAFAAATEIVALSALQGVAEEVLPPYRRQFADANRRALALGFDWAPKGSCMAWHEVKPAA